MDKCPEEVSSQWKVMQIHRSQEDKLIEFNIKCREAV